MGQCAQCAEEIKGHLELILDHPDGEFIQIFRCIYCGSERACRPGWTTRCHVCHDERTAGSWLEESEVIYRNWLAESSEGDVRDLETSLREFANIGNAELDLHDIADFVSAECLAAELDLKAQTGWTLLGTDICGMPWYYDPDKTNSHGTWAVHDACGRVQKLEPGRGHTECRRCPPDPASCTYRARQEDKHFLYLVGFEDLIKFGHGDEARVRAHRRAGAKVIQVLEASHGAVVRAELVLKRQHAKVSRGKDRAMPRTFGAGTEVLSAASMFDLCEVLDGVDVTLQFEPSRIVLAEPATLTLHPSEPV
jgi:hypothetical protein